MVTSQCKTAFITGASSGLGAEFAHQLASQGYNLVITARRLDRLQLLAESIQAKYGSQVIVHAADLANTQDIEQLSSSIAQINDLSLLVNCAGFSTVGRFHRVDPAKELAMLNVHTVAPVMFSRAALPGMLARDQGAIINVASLAGLIPIRNVLYHSTKAFLISFSTVLQMELLGTQLHIQALCPGFVYTGFHDTPEYSGFSRQAIPRFLWMTPPQVVSQSLKALQGHQLICIPGTIYRIAGWFARNSLSAGLIKRIALFILRKRKTFPTTR